MAAMPPSVERRLGGNCDTVHTLPRIRYSEALALSAFTGTSTPHTSGLEVDGTAGSGSPT
ncbi:hypothetical protein [Azospirillum melinis]